MKPTVLRCPDGRMHQFAYLGAGSQMYRCSECGSLVPKASLKAATEPTYVLQPGKDVALA